MAPRGRTSQSGAVERAFQIADAQLREAGVRSSGGFAQDAAMISADMEAVFSGRPVANYSDIVRRRRGGFLEGVASLAAGQAAIVDGAADIVGFGSAGHGAARRRKRRRG